ncbi:mitogen-activated protein kinase kinase kinase 1-like isoform X3 [Dendronephthya gigantea]|uniref:mitogen-activated protein kinase kinase kinase 1-like isoform X3 n=1 Tax=Dendronephthya gigantea TaxID=151771 RepID=UPI00106D6385|nr:mitogen-activated protein kinase kinase kinase 1-like isoform X3 [Dendronephthya gigantea]
MDFSNVSTLFLVELWEAKLKKLKHGVVRPPSPNFSTSASSVGAKQVNYTVASSQNLRPSSPPHRRKTPSSSPSGSPGPSTPRSASPTLLFDVQQMATENQHRVEKAMKVRLYLLQQTGPNSFLIGGDSPSHKFRVMIGPQTCSCSKGPFCVHLLFVMLRVFKLKDNDPLLWEKQLKNYEVEMLFHKFHASVSSRIGSKTKSVTKSKQTPRRGVTDSHVQHGSAGSGLAGSSPRSDEFEVQCPICLLEMVDGESLTICDGCSNTLHQHCMAIWAAECKRQKEALVCPLCRKIWANKTKNVGKNEETRPSVVEPDLPSTTSQVDAIPLDNESILPHCDPIPSEHIEHSKPWVEMFGEDLVCCLYSKEWNYREKGLQHLCKEMKSILTNENSSLFTERLLSSCCKIIAMMCADPVYPVYVHAVRALRVLLAYMSCRSTAEKGVLQRELSPVLEAIIMKCADSNRRVSSLSTKTLVELCKDESGDMALGAALSSSAEGNQSLGGINYVLSRTVVRSPENVTWPWWLGRLYLLVKLLEESPDYFRIETETVDYKKVSMSIRLPSSPNRLPENTNQWENNFSRLMFIVHFAIKATSCPHSKGNKIALRILTRCLKLASKVHSAFIEVKTCLSELKKSDRNALQRQLKHRQAPQRGVSVDSAYCSGSAENTQNLPETSAHTVSLSDGDGNSLDGIPDLSNDDVDIQMSELENFRSLVELDDSSDRSFPLTPPGSPGQDEDKRQNALSPSLPPIDVPLTTTKCQKKIEEEEAEALAIAIEASTLQPLVPPPIEKLVADDSEEIVVRVQPEKGDEADGKDSNDKHVYLEGVHWTKTELLGTGAFSSCYAARDKSRGTLMAVKQVSFCRNSSDEQQKVTDTIMEEISIMSKVQHPNLTTCLGVTRHAGHFNIFLEWMAGGSLAKLLSTHGPLEEKVAVSYTQQITRGVAYLHEHHVIHRDIKGANILLDSTGHVVKVADFGAVARLKTEKTFSGEFQGQLLGTIAFMAPEVLRGESYGRKCDVWSIGCVVIEMMTGKPPWNANQHSNHLALIFKIACSRGPPDIPDGVNPGFRDLILRCLDTNPQERSAAVELLKHPVFTRVCR